MLFGNGEKRIARPKFDAIVVCFTTEPRSHGATEPQSHEEHEGTHWEMKIVIEDEGDEK